MIDLAFRKQKFSEFADEEFNGCRLIDTKLFKLGPTDNFTLDGLRTFHTELILWKPHDCFMALAARVRGVLRIP